MIITRRSLLRLIKESLDISTFDVEAVQSKASKAFDKVEAIVKITDKMKVKNVTGYLGKAKAYYIKNTEEGQSHANLSKTQDYLFRADDLFHKIRDNASPSIEDVKDFERSASTVLRMLERFDQIHGATAAKMFGIHGLGGIGSQPGISAAEFTKLKSLHKEAKKLYEEIISMCTSAQEEAPGESEQPTSPSEPAPAKPTPTKPGGQAQKKKKGWGNHPPEMKVAWLAFLKNPDYKKVHGPKGGTYSEWQRWYMTATKDPQSWELLGAPQKKYLNSDQVTKILKMLADPSSINESLSRGSLYRNRYRRY